MKHYILQGREIVECDDWLAWARWFETAKDKRIVAQTHLIDGSTVSTVFLGLDHAFGGGPPVLFETALMMGEREYSALMGREYRPTEVVDRYCTWAEAEAGHMAWVERCVPPDLVKANAEHERTDES